VSELAWLAENGGVQVSGTVEAFVRGCQIATIPTTLMRGGDRYERINALSAKGQILAATSVRLRQNSLTMNAVWARAGAVHADSAPQCEKCRVQAEDLVPTCMYCPPGKAPRG
jgi:hypothetical protein